MIWSRSFIHDSSGTFFLDDIGISSSRLFSHSCQTHVCNAQTHNALKIFKCQCRNTSDTVLMHIYYMHMTKAVLDALLLEFLPVLQHDVLGFFPVTPNSASRCARALSRRRSQSSQGACWQHQTITCKQACWFFISDKSLHVMLSAISKSQSKSSQEYKSVKSIFECHGGFSGLTSYHYLKQPTILASGAVHHEIDHQTYHHRLPPRQSPTMAVVCFPSRRFDSPPEEERHGNIQMHKQITRRMHISMHYFT